MNCVFKDLAYKLISLAKCKTTHWYALKIPVVHLVPVHPLLKVQIPGLEHHPLLHPPLHTATDIIIAN